MVKTRRKRTRKHKGGGGLLLSYPSFNVNDSVTNIKNTEGAPKLTLLPLPLSTFIMYDPDADLPLWVHWLVINIPNGDIRKGDIVLSYTGPSPPPNTGTHRYIFNQLEQTEPIYIKTQKRSKYNIDEFIKTYKLIPRATKSFMIVSAVE
jgi:phosphatidylethanolamine-binding protein (PEBP) family uncharacterized protein